MMNGGGGGMMLGNTMVGNGMVGGYSMPAPPLQAGGPRPCRFRRDCHRADCYYSHPEGRKIDSGAQAPRGSLSHIDALARTFSNLSTSSQDSSDRSVGGAAKDQELMDTWFSKAMHCTCCKGYIYGCTNEICSSLGMCTCSVEENDIDLGPSSDKSLPTTTTTSNLPQTAVKTPGAAQSAAAPATSEA